MAGLNKVLLIGNVGKDPEIRSLNNGGRVATFSLATSETWKDKQSGVTLVGNQLVVTWSVIGERDNFLNWIEDRRMRFDVGKPPEEQPDLFDSVGPDIRGM